VPEFDPFEHEELPPALQRGTSQPAPAFTGPRAAEAAPTAAGPGRAETTRSAPDGQAGLARVRERWNVVVEELRRTRAKRAAALLDEAQLQRCEGGVVVIGFRYDAQRELWDGQGDSQRLAAALQAVLGQPFQVRTEKIVEADEAEERGSTPSQGRGAAPPDRPSPPAREAPAAVAGQSAPDILEGEPLVREVIALFDGKIVEGDERA
jgi:hypothetical protein